MRSTCTIAEDVAAMLHRLHEGRGGRFNRPVTEALRAGLKQKQVGARPKNGRPFQTSSADLGRCLPGNVDTVAGILLGVQNESYE